MTTILIGRKELFSFADRYSAGRLADYSGLGDGEVLCCLFSLVFPDFRIRPAPAQTHSSTQRARANWEALFRRFARLHIPLAFLNPPALQAGEAECGFSTLALFYFLHNLSKRADFAAEFALDVADDVTAYLQSTACIVTLLLGNALDWAAVPPALAPTLRQHPAFDMAESEAAALEAAAARTYRQTYARPRPRSSAMQQPQQRTRDATDLLDQPVTAARRRGGPPPARAHRTAGGGSSSSSASSAASLTGAEQRGTLHAAAAGEGGDDADSPVPRPPHGSAASSHSSRSTTPPAPSLHPRTRSGERGAAVVGQHGAGALPPPPPLHPAVRRASANASSASSSAVASASFTTARTSASRTSSASASRASSLSRSASFGSSLGDSAACAATGSAQQTTAAPLYRSAASVRPAPSTRAAAVTELEEALQRKEAECETLQMRVAQLLTHLADARSTAAAAATTTTTTTASPPRASASEAALYEARIAELEAQLRDAEAERLQRRARHSPCPPPHAVVPMDKAALEAEIAALTADVVHAPEDGDGECESAAAGTPVDVHETANLLHCLMLEQLHDAPRNRAQMQRWLWSIVEAHHTLEGRLMAAVDLLRVWSASLDSSRGAGDGRAASASTARRSASTVAAPFLASTALHDDANLKAPASVAAERQQAERLASARSAHAAELAALHTHEHALRTALESAQTQHAATVQRAVRRERLWKALCASVYAAEQASYAITECSTAEQVEARLREREHHYGTVESLTQQLVEAGPHEKTSATPVDEAAATSSPCASMQALVRRLQEERDELLRDVAQLHAALPETPPQHDEPSWPREQPTANASATRTSALATAAAGDFEAWMASVPHPSPNATRGLAALLQAQHAPTYRVAATAASR